jgi:hypothetical protein
MMFRRSPDHTPVPVSRADVSDQAAIPMQVYRHVGRPPYKHTFWVCC